MKTALGRHWEAVRFGTEALDLHKRLGEKLRIANTQGYLANSYEDLGRRREAAESRQDSGRYFEAVEMWESAAQQYERAMILWNVLGERDHAVSCVERWVRCRVLSKDPQLEEDALEEVAEIPSGMRSRDFYVRALKTLARRPENISLNTLVRSLTIYCERHYDPQEKQFLEQALEEVAHELTCSPSAELLRAIATGVEQANEETLRLPAFDALAEYLTGAVDHLHHRSTTDGLEVWTIGLQWQRPLVVQIVCMSEDHATRRVGMALAVLLSADGVSIEDSVLVLANSKEDGFALHLVSQEDAEESNGMTGVTFEGDSQPAIATESNVSWEERQPPTYLILRGDYGSASDWTSEPYNKAFVWVLMNEFVALVAHCAHRRRNDVPEIGEDARRFCESALN